MTRNGRNLALLGIGAALVALTTTGVSLAIYHNSGDIYLDRSRPGYLPDKDEIEQEDGSDEGVYVFNKEGIVTSGDVEEYVENLKKEVEALDVYKNAFSDEALSDEKLGL
ncbi:hypothetical protein IJJ39_00945 [Candidatus Saccharibacteria bacterium]|nr:hypothetical protein [Candidatus Saccharibacteria bacterium]